MENHILEMYGDVRKNFENNPDFMIGFYSRNRSALEKISRFTVKEELQAFIEIVAQYLNALFQKGRFNDVVDFANLKLTIIDKELVRLNSEELRNYWYNSILHFKGMAAYRIRDYKTSTPIYKYLTEVDPKNENFRDWLNYSSYRQKQWLVKTINAVCGLLVLIYFFGKDYIHLFEVRVSILSLAVLGMIITWSYEYYINRGFKRSVTHEANRNGL